MAAPKTPKPAPDPIALRATNMACQARADRSRAAYQECLLGLTSDQLRAHAKHCGLKNVSSARKDDLLRLLNVALPTPADR